MHMRIRKLTKSLEAVGGVRRCRLSSTSLRWPGRSFRMTPFLQPLPLPAGLAFFVINPFLQPLPLPCMCSRSFFVLDGIFLSQGKLLAGN